MPHVGVHDVPPFVDVHIPPEVEPARNLFELETSIAKARVLPPTFQGPRDCQMRLLTESTCIPFASGEINPGRVEAYSNSNWRMLAGIFPVSGSRRRWSSY